MPMRRRPRPRVFLLAAMSLSLSFWSATSQAQTTARPAEIVSVTPGGVGYVNSSTGTNGLTAQIGRWDAPYPNPDTGERAPGLEPDGASTLRVTINVNDGGLVSFSYRLRTYDAGIYDWFDASMENPSGTKSFVSQLGKPGSAYGTYFESDPPARSTIGVAALPLGATVEIDAILAVPD